MHSRHPGGTRQRFSAGFALLLLHGLPLQALCAPFTAGNVLVLATAGTTSAASPVTLREYNKFGTLVQTVALNATCTLSGTATADAKLSTSVDGTMVSWGCYTCPVGTLGIATVR